MVSNRDLEAVEKIINYQFKSKALLSEALTAAGADSENYDGNRKLAEIGVLVLDLCVSINGFEKTARGHTAALKQKLQSSNHRALVARRTTIDRYIRYNTRSGTGQSTVVGKAVIAIIGAACRDCGNLTTAWDIMHHISYFAQDNHGVDPKMLEHGVILENNLPSVGSLACQNCGELRILNMAESAILTRTQNPGTTGWEPGQTSSNSWSSTPENNVEWEVNFTHKQLPGPRKRNVKALRDDGNENHTSNNKRTARSANYHIIKFIDTETAKCRAAGLPLPEESYYSADIQARILDAVHGRSIDIARKLLLCAGSSQSVASLHAAIQSWRTQADIKSWQLTQSPSKSKTFNIIECINRDIVCLNLLRRYHILRLFEECRGCETPSSAQYVQFSGDTSMVSGKSGNPRNNAETEVAMSMMKEIFPHLQPGTREHTEKATVVKSLRQLGRRFYTLTQHLGRGILAFIPYHDLPGQPDLGISDNMILRIPERTFLEVVLILERSQGDILRGFSAAALKIVNTLLHDSGNRSATFNLEMFGTNEILELPKNSQQLFQLLI